MTRRLLPLLALVLTALLVGCRAQAPKVADAQALLASAATKMAQPGPFHFELVQQNGTTAIAGVEMISASGDVAASDRLRMNLKGRAMGMNLDVSIVILPDGAYITNPLTGKWQRTDLSATALFDPSTGVPAIMRAVTDPRVTGAEAIGGVPTARIEAKIDSAKLALLAPGAEAGRSLTARAWIGVADQRVYRVEVTGAATAADAANMVRRLELSRFGEDPRIEAPALP